MSRVELLPCRHCGNKATVESAKDRHALHHATVVCTKCDFQIDASVRLVRRDAVRAAARDWNSVPNVQTEQGPDWRHTP